MTRATHIAALTAIIICLVLFAASFWLNRQTRTMLGEAERAMQRTTAEQRVIASSMLFVANSTHAADSADTYAAALLGAVRELRDTGAVLRDYVPELPPQIARGDLADFPMRPLGVQHYFQPERPQ